MYSCVHACTEVHEDLTYVCIMNESYRNACSYYILRHIGTTMHATFIIHLKDLSIWIPIQNVFDQFRDRRRALTKRLAMTHYLQSRKVCVCACMCVCECVCVYVHVRACVHLTYMVENSSLHVYVSLCMSCLLYTSDAADE